jgi:hypothetical protein
MKCGIQYDFSVTYDTNIRNFQYKITHRIIACTIASKHNLKMCKIKMNDLCDPCTELDTIKHLLVECEHTYKFWQQIFKWLANNMKVWFQIDTDKILFGITK